MAASLSLLLVVAVPAQGAERASADDTARFLAGMPPSAASPLLPLTRSAAWQHHAAYFDTAFGGAERRQLSRIRAWSGANVKTNPPVLFYMFSGPDFLYANAFFPGAPTYVLSGLEPVGDIPDLVASPGAIPRTLGHLRGSLRSILGMSFFRTHDMRRELRGGPVTGGTLQILYVFLARSGKVISDVSLVSLNAQGELQPGHGNSAARGVRIGFSEKGGRPQTLYYFETNLANNGFATSGFAKFCEKLGEGSSFIKSASYLLHSENFSQVRTFLLDRSKLILQDDTGIPVTQFDARTWQLHPFGNYAGPIRMFSRRYQPKMRELYLRGRPAPIDFGLGYRWRRGEIEPAGGGAAQSGRRGPAAARVHPVKP